MVVFHGEEGCQTLFFEQFNLLQNSICHFCRHLDLIDEDILDLLRLELIVGHLVSYGPLEIG